MTSIAKLGVRLIRAPRLDLSWLFRKCKARRRRTTIDLIHASPHLLRDIGALDGLVCRRRR